MRGPYGLEVNDGCKTCKNKEAEYFCQLGSGALRDFEAIKTIATYPKGAILFLEKQDSRGVFLLCEGEVKLSVSSREGKTLIMRIARAGEVLGLMATLAGTTYEVTAETIYPCQVAFIRRDDFERYIASHPAVALNLTKQMCAQYQSACDQLRTVGLSSSAHEKLARLLLAWSEGVQQTREGTRIKLPLTHEEIAEFIGTTRETVTRTLSDFKIRQLVAIQGATLTIPNRAALEHFANG